MINTRILFLLLFLLSFIPPGAFGDNKGIISTLTVSGTGEIKGSPDIAKLSVTSTSRGTTAQEATSKNAEAATILLNTLKSQGISDKDIKTSNISISPVFDIENNSNNIIGYEASNSFTVTIRKISDSGKIIDSISNAGNYTISSISFSIEDDDALEDEAFKVAVKNARHKADIVAKEAGKDIAGIKSINVNNSSGGIIFADALGVKESTPVLPGDITVSASVTIEYLIGR